MEGAHSRSTLKADGEAFHATLGEERITPPSSKTTFTSERYDFEAIIRECYNVTLIGTIPEAAGKGLGRGLMQIVLDKADEEGVGVWVPTTYQPRVSTWVPCEDCADLRYGSTRRWGSSI